MVWTKEEKQFNSPADSRILDFLPNRLWYQLRLLSNPVLPGLKRPRRETEHSPPSSAQVKKTGNVRINLILRRVRITIEIVKKQ